MGCGTKLYSVARLNRLCHSPVQNCAQSILSSLLCAMPQPSIFLSAANPAFATKLHQYLDEYGCRSLSYDVIDPTLAEVPEAVIGVVRNELAGGSTTKKRDLRELRRLAEEKALASLAGDVDAREEFESILKAACASYPTLDDNTYYTQNLGDALSRYALLELGRRLARRGATRTEVRLKTYTGFCKRRLSWKQSPMTLSPRSQGT